MLKLENVGMKRKLTMFFLLVGLAPLLIAGWYGSRLSEGELMKKSFNQLEAVRALKKARIEKYFADKEGDIGALMETVDTLRTEAVNKLVAVREIKKNQIENYFKNAFMQMSVFAESSDVKLLFDKLVQYHKDADVTADGSYDVASGAYETIYKQFGVKLNRFKERSGFYDVFIICAKHGHVMYSAAGESDLGENLGSGALKKSGLAHLWAKTVETGKPAFVDFKPYAPSNGEPASFAGYPIMNETGGMAGIIAFQTSLEQISRVMQERAGLGETGETYLVGPDKLMRSDSFLDPDNHSVKASFADPGKGSVDTEASRAALSGKTGADVIMDYNGSPVLSAYTPVKIGDITWGLLAEVDVAEAFCPKDAEGIYYFEKYNKIYGYQDLFLINSDGYCFYTAARAPEYQTNLQRGKFADSGLGRLVGRVMESKAFGFADFEPYEPSKGEPASFIARPVVHDGRVEMVVALRIPLDAINAIMQQRDGMGKTGETYLVGPDKRMRSDSFLDKEGRSVKASFAGDVANNGVDTESVKKALAGKSHQKVVLDYNGNPVLSAYTPVKLWDVTWALLAEIDEAEVKEPVRRMYVAMGVLGVIILVVVTIVAFLIARSIAAPLAKGVAFVKRVAEGDLTARVDADRKDELGVLAAAMNSISTNLGSMFRDISNDVETLSSSSTELSAISEQMSEGAEQTSGKSAAVAAAAEEMSVNMSSVAAAMEEASTNVSMVAAGAEEMTATIGEIARNTEKARGVTGRAVARANNASGQMGELGQAAQRIGNVIETITEISDQVNLLALNATIEAARAGEAGKGFAVVANEIKDLARQTAEATDEIKTRVGGIQTSTDQTVGLISDILTIVNEIDQIVSTIATAVEEQSATTREIAESVSQASTGIGEVNENVSQASMASGEIAKEITDVTHASDEMTNSSSQVNMSAEELSALANKINEMMGRFRV
ncbi:MAG: methyl-accepting chemotaxis protein [Desulfobacterales bacterium]|nr:methyl-accepting chemotaxis protein [Desulfobacterales bacterium]